MIPFGLLRHRVTVARNTPTVRDSGFAAPSWSTRATDRPCSIQPRTERQRIFIEGRLQNGENVGFFQIGEDLIEGDRVTVTAGPSLVGIAYDVLMVDDAAGQGEHLECALQPYQPGG